MKKAIIFLLLAGGFKGFAQTKPVHISVVQGVSTQGAESANNDYYFSFNLFSGTIHNLKGIEIGSIYNQNNGNMIGFQTSGVLNYTKGNVKGFQNSGVTNISGSVIGFQNAGVSNHSKNMIGVQASGIVNTALDVEGVQLTGILNKAKKLKGYQIAIINIADEVENGGGIGLLNLYKKGGYREIEISTADYQNIGLSFKSGTKTLYTILNIGYNFNPETLFSTGGGIGRIIDLKKKWALKPEITWYNYVEDDFNFNNTAQLSHFRFGLMRKVNKVGFTLIPSIYYAKIPKNVEGNLSQISSLKPFSKTKNGQWGFGIGLGVAFLK